MAPVVAEIHEYGRQVPRQRIIPRQIQYAIIVVDLNVGPVFDSPAKDPVQ